MSERMKQHLTEENLYHIVVDGPEKQQFSYWISKEIFEQLRSFLSKPSESNSKTWEEIASDRIAKYGKVGLAIRGARIREELSQKELAKLSGVSQENISRIENGKRHVGQQVAERLAIALKINVRLLLS